MLKSTVASVAGLSALTATDAAAMPAAPTPEPDTKHAQNGERRPTEKESVKITKLETFLVKPLSGTGQSGRRLHQNPIQSTGRIH
jgi:hypothetical protein